MYNLVGLFTPFLIHPIREFRARSGPEPGSLQLDATECTDTTLPIDRESFRPSREVANPARLLLHQANGADTVSQKARFRASNPRLRKANSYAVGGAGE